MSGERRLVGLLAHPGSTECRPSQGVADLRIAGNVVVDEAEIDRRRGRDVVDRERAPGLVHHAGLVGAHLVAHRGVLEEIQVALDADRLQVPDHRLGLVALAIGVERQVEAVRIAGLGQHLLRLCGSYG